MDTGEGWVWGWHSGLIGNCVEQVTKARWEKETKDVSGKDWRGVTCKCGGKRWVGWRSGGDKREMRGSGMGDKHMKEGQEQGDWSGGEHGCL